jgi:hypothetical protein
MTQPSVSLPVAAPRPINALPRVTTELRALDDGLWALLTRPGPLTADEWAYIKAHERAGSCS